MPGVFLETLPPWRLAGGTDTTTHDVGSGARYRRVARAGYGLTMRRGLPEPGAGDQLIMAGHEAMLAQWFHRPLRRRDIELARHWFRERSAVSAFPDLLWDTILSSQPGEDIFLPVDIWGFPGGQAFLPGVPCLFFEGMGGAISYLEPAMCRYFVPIIQATKARLMKLATPRDAEFGLAPDRSLQYRAAAARYRRRPRAADFERHCGFIPGASPIGTIGHELMCAAQTLERPLAVPSTR